MGGGPDKTIPAVEIGGADLTLNCQFHDIGGGSFSTFDQQYKYKINGSNTIVLKGVKGSNDIIDNGSSTTYLQTNITTPTSVSFITLDDNSSNTDG